MAAPVKQEFLSRCETSIRNLKNLQDSFVPSDNGDQIPDPSAMAQHLPAFNLDQQRFHQGMAANAQRDQMADMWKRAFSNLSGPVQLYPPDDPRSKTRPSAQPSSPFAVSSSPNISVA